MSQPIRVLYITHNAALGGSAGSLRYLIENLPPGSVEPYVLCPDGPAVASFRKSGINVLNIPGVSMLQSIAGVPLRGRRLADLAQTVWYMRYGGIISKTIRIVRPDIVHLNDRGTFQAAGIAFRAGIPVVMHIRCVQDRRTRWLKTLTATLTNRYVSRVITIDKSVDWSVRELKRRQVIYNPLNFSRGTRIPEIREPVPDLGKARETRVTFLSGLLPFKGIWDLLESAKILRARAEIIFQIAGTNGRPPEFHRSLTGKIAHLFGLALDLETGIKQWIAREGLQDKILMLGHVEQIETLFRNTDIVVFPSHLNGPGRSVFEAGAHGLPTIVSLEDKIEDVVEDGVTGIITPPHDPQALAKAIVKLAGDPDLRARLGRNAQRKCLVQFDPQRIGRQMLEVYQSLVSESTMRRAG